MIKLKTILMMSCLIVFGILKSETNQNFTPTLKEGLYCVPKYQMFKLISDHDELIEVKKKLTEKTNEINNYIYKIDMLELEVQRADERVKFEQRKKIKVFFQGVAVGGGFASLGIAILVFKIVL